MFVYVEEKNIAKFYFLLDILGTTLIRGPPIEKKENVIKFKKNHKKIFIKNKLIYASENHDLKFIEFFKIFKQKYQKTIKQMGIEKIDIIK